MFSTLIKELSDNEPVDVHAKAYNNRGHARYMRVEFDAALADYDFALQTGLQFSKFL